MAKLTDWDAPLQDLWRRRDDLDEREWEQLYQLTSQILLACPCKEYQGLNLPLEECVLDFFTHKVFEPASRDGHVIDTPIHAGALRYYFQNFLIDLHRAGPEAPHLSLDDQETGPRLIEVLRAPESEVPEGLSADIQQRIATAADEFLQSQEPWARLYLRYHFCAPCFNRTPVRLVRFKGHIPSYNAKAQKLGLAPPTDGDYRRTLLGRWLRSLNLPEIFDDRDVAQAALKILCQQSLLRVKDELPFTDAADPANDDKEE
ncbi:MAG: hypothetical protein QG599_917 [Pseudomonadota bacterium]|nr:hypothetical protein [Pseudomonadota bacterium]